MLVVALYYKDPGHRRWSHLLSGLFVERICQLLAAFSGLTVLASTIENSGSIEEDPLPNDYNFLNYQNNRGSFGRSLAISSSSGYWIRSGSGTFTLDSFNMLISCSAFTTPLA